MRPFRRSVTTLHAAFVLLSTGCIPYTVGTTAQPVPKDESIESLAVTVMPPVGTLHERGHSFLSADGEVRRGIDSVSDFGVRIVSISGLVVSYKRLLTAPSSPVLFSVLTGGGFVNLGSHAHFEATAIISANERAPLTAPPASNRGRIVPYGGVRAMQVVPIQSDAVHDDPTLGAFFGVRFGRQELGISAEVGVFHDRSALEVRSHDVVIVPAVVVHGREMLDMLPGIGRPSRPPRFPRPRY